MFIGIMGMIIVPLFLIVSAKMVANSDFSKRRRIGADVIQVFLYGCATVGFLGVVALVVYAVNNS